MTDKGNAINVILCGVYVFNGHLRSCSVLVAGVPFGRFVMTDVGLGDQIWII